MLNNPFYDDSETVEEYSEETTEEYTSEEESPVEATETPNNDDEEILGDESEEYEEEDDSPDIEDNEDYDSNEEEVEYEEFEVPEYIPNDFMPPDTFATPEEGLEWYKNKYIDLMQYHTSEEYFKSLEGTIQQSIQKIGDNREKYIAIDSLLKEKPELAMKLYAPQYLAEKGHNSVITEDEIEDVIYQVLSNEFGEDYMSTYNPSAASNPKTLSGRMYLRQQELLRQIDVHNQQATKYIEEYKPLDEETIQKTLQSEYERDFKPDGFTEEEFKEFIIKARDITNNIKLTDIHRVMYFDDYLQSEYERGVRDGKKNLTKDIKRAGNAVQQVPPQPRNRTVKGNDSFMPERYLKGNPFSMNGK